MARESSISPVEDCHATPLTRKSLSKNAKAIVPRESKRANLTLLHEQHGPAGVEKKHRRVRKACERCRIKKTKVRTHPAPPHPLNSHINFFSVLIASSVTETCLARDAKRMV